MNARNLEKVKRDWTKNRARVILDEIFLFLQRNGGNKVANGNGIYELEFPTLFDTLRVKMDINSFPAKVITINCQFESKSEVVRKDAEHYTGQNHYSTKSDWSGWWIFRYFWVPTNENSSIINDFRKAIISVMDPAKVHERDAKEVGGYKVDTVKVYKVSHKADNDEWPEDRRTLYQTAIVAARSEVNARMMVLESFNRTLSYHNWKEIGLKDLSSYSFERLTTVDNYEGIISMDEDHD